MLLLLLLPLSDNLIVATHLRSTLAAVPSCSKMLHMSMLMLLISMISLVTVLVADSLFDNGGDECGHDAARYNDSETCQQKPWCHAFRCHGSYCSSWFRV